MKRVIGLKIVLYTAILFAIGCAGRQEFKKKDINEERMKSYLADKPEELKPG
jgi:hypothetical protein